MSNVFSRIARAPAAPVEAPDAEHETKFVLPGRAGAQVLGRLRGLCTPDASHPAGIVSSIYYDGVGWSSVEEKRNSDYVKTKVRVRWYADAATGEPLGSAFVEAKVRIGTARFKVRIDTGLPAARVARLPLDDREVLELPRVLERAGFVLPGPTLPAFEVSYARHRFVEPETMARISLDEDIRVVRTNPSRMPPPRPLPLPSAVLEVKGGPTDLPPRLGGLTRLGCRRESFSKYGACHRWITGGVE